MRALLADTVRTFSRNDGRMLAGATAFFALVEGPNDTSSRATPIISASRVRASSISAPPACAPG